MSSPNDSVLCYPLPYCVAPVFVQVVSPPLGWSPLTSFLVIWYPSGDARGPSVVFEAVDIPCPGPFHFSHSVDYIYEFCPLPNPDVGPSIFICDVEHTSFQPVHVVIQDGDTSWGSLPEIKRHIALGWAAISKVANITKSNQSMNQS